MLRQRLSLPFLLLLLILPVVGVALRPLHPAHAQTGPDLNYTEPAYTYGSYLGGRSDDRFRAIATDAQGNIYLAGSTYSTDFPGVSGKQASSEDIVIVSFDATGTTLRWAKTLGGSDTDQANGLAFDQNGHLWLTGFTESTDFPVSAGGTTFAGYYDIVLAELDSATGAVLYSNLFGGENLDQGTAIVAAPNGLLYITGQASDEFNFWDALAMSFDPQTHTIGKMVRFGRERGADIGHALAVDRDSNVYITGVTEPQGQDTDFPLVDPFQAQCGIGDGFGDCGEDAFITKLNPALDRILYSTYLGGSYNESEMASGDDTGTGIGVGADGSIYVTGYTFATNFPVVNAAQATKQGAGNFTDAFVARLNPTTNTLIFSTYLGGEDWEEGHALYLESNGNVTVGGLTNAPDFPVLHAPQPTLGNGICNLGGSERYCYDGFVAQFAANGTLRWSTYVGGGLDDDLAALVMNTENSVLLTGASESHNFPVSANAYQASKALSQDGFLAQLGSAGATPTPTPTVSPTQTPIGVPTNTPTVTPTVRPNATPIATPIASGDQRVLLPLVQR
jgi:hypothetical protein